MSTSHTISAYEINQTKIKGSCQLGRKVVLHDSKSDLPLVDYILRELCEMMSSEPHHDCISPLHFSRELQDNHVTHIGYLSLNNFSLTDGPFLVIANSQTSPSSNINAKYN